MTTKRSFAEAVPPTRVAPRRANAMALAIHTVTGQRLVVDDGMRSDTLARLRARISLTHGIAAGTQRLMIDQVTLEEGPQTLVERGIGPESALFLSLQAADHLITESKSAVAAAETAAAEANTAVQGQMEALPQPCSRLMLYRDDGSPKHWRWFHLSRDAEGVASVRWGKNKDGSDHRLWASCGSAPPKSCEVHGVSIEEGPAGSDYGFKILRTGQPLLVAALDGETEEKWVGVLDAVQSHREAVGALEQAREALRQGPAEVARREEEAREAQRFVEVEQLLTTAERQMGAEEFGAAVVTLRRALTLDGANKEAWAALERVAFVLDGRIYDVGDDGRLDLAGRKLGREGVTKLARWLATNAGAALNSVTVDSTGTNGWPQTYMLTVGDEKIDLSSKNLGPADANLMAIWLQRPEVMAAVARLSLSGNMITGSTNINVSTAKYDNDLSGINALCEVLPSLNTRISLDISRCGLSVGAVTDIAHAIFAGAKVRELILSGNAISGSTKVDSEWNKFDLDLTGLVELCDALLTLKDPIELDLSNCGLSVNGVNPVAKAISAGAVVDEVNVSMNLIGVDGAQALGAVLVDSSLKCLIIGPKSTRLTVNDGEVTELNFEGQGFTPTEVTLVAAAISTMAALNSVTVDSTGATKDPKTYTITVGDEKIDLSSKNLGSADVALVAAWLQRPEVSAAVDSIDLSGCGLAGATKTEYIVGKGEYAWEKIDSNMDGFIALCAVIGNVRTIRLADCGLGPGSAAELSKVFTNADAALNSLKCANNPGMVGELEYGRLKTPDAHAEVFKQLTDNLKTSQVTEADFSSCGLGPVALGHLSEWVRDAEAAVARLILDENPLTGGWSNVDKDITGVTSLFDTLKTSSVTELGLANCRLGPGSLGKLAEYVRDAEAVVNSLTIDSTGNMRDRKTYTLTVGEEKIDLSKKSLGSADVALVATWLQRPEVMAVVARLILDENPLTGGVWYGVDKDITGVTSLCDSLKTSSVTELGLAKCRLGPGSLAKLAEYVHDAEAAVTSINCLHNPLGEAVHIIIKVFEETPRLRTLCGFEEGVEQIDWSKSQKGPVEVALLAADLKAGRAIAAINSVTVDSTGDPHYNNGGPKPYTLTVGEDKIELSSKNLGPADVALVATWLQRPEVSAALNSLTLDSNGIFGLLDFRYSDPTTEPDKFVEQCEAFFASLKTSNINTLSLKWTGMGPVALQKLATSLPAAVASLRFANNPGMVGELEYGRLKTPDVHAEVFKQLADNLKTSQVTEADFSSCGLGPVALGHLSEWVRDATAAVTSVNCLANKFGEDDLATLLTAIEGTSVRSLCGLTEGQTTADFSGQKLYPIDCKIIAAEFGFRGFIAALNSVVLDDGEITGTKIKDKGYSFEKIEQLDADLSGFTSLCTSLKSSQIQSLSLQKCYLGPEALTLLADAIKFMAVLTKIDIRGAYIGEEVFAGLKGVAPEGCEVFWSEGDEGRVH